LGDFRLAVEAAPKNAHAKYGLANALFTTGGGGGVGGRVGGQKKGEKGEKKKKTKKKNGGKTGGGKGGEMEAEEVGDDEVELVARRKKEAVVVYGQAVHLDPRLHTRRQFPDLADAFSAAAAEWRRRETPMKL
jgi:hypothetical protein